MKDINTEEGEPAGQQNSRQGVLFVVATPIGNLEDITLRALKTLKDVHLIAAENTSHTKGLCGHYGIRTKLTSYNQHNSKSKGRELIKAMKAGSDVALVTSAGTPGISDPGSLLINEALEAGIRVSPIPGPSAAITALSVCGLKVDRFVFLGFLPNSPGKRRKNLLELRREPKTMIFYESPRRIVSLLKDMLEAFGDRTVVLLRELTKVYEEIKRGNISSLLEEMGEDTIKGEFTVIVSGGEREVAVPDMNINKRIKALLKNRNTGAKDIATTLSEELGVNYRVIYRQCLDAMKELNR
jgi:16S rRNA (cytidine1402-2'-O)-methyltransferase